MGFFDSLQHGVQNFAPMALPAIGAGAGYYFGGPMGGMLGASAGSTMGAMFQNYQNFRFQENQLDYQKNLQKQMLAREDNAVYRRTMDLKRSGLSPVLAAGSAAGSGPIVSTKALERARDPDTAAIIMSLLKMKEEISNTIAQRDLIDQQTSRAQAEANIKWHDWKVFNGPAYKNVPSNAGGLLGQFAGMLSAGEFDKIPQDAKEVLDKVSNFVNKGNWFNMPKVKYNPKTNKMEPIK